MASKGNKIQHELADQMVNHLQDRVDKLWEKDFFTPILALQKERVDQITKSLEYNDKIYFKNFDVLIDVLKVLLSVSGTIWIAEHSIKNFVVNTYLINCIVLLLVIFLIVLLAIRTWASNNAIKIYKSLMDTEAKRFEYNTELYIKEGKRRIKNIEKQFKTIKSLVKLKNS